MATVTTTRAADGHSRRAELLEAADRVVRAEGPDASMSLIAAAAGITKPVLYRYFGDKTGLYRALADRHTQALLAELERALHTVGRRGRTEAAIDAYLRTIEQNPQAYRFLLRHASAEEPLLRSFARSFGDLLAAGITKELGLSAAEAGRAGAWAHGIVGMVEGAGDWWLATKLVSRRVLVRQLADLLWGGLAAGRDSKVAASPTASSRIPFG